MTSTPNVGVLNLGTGNLRSVWNAVYSLGHEVLFVDNASQLDDCTHLLLPGVGAFHTAMRSIDSLALAEPLRTFAASGRPMAGLCLGMQLLGTGGDEGTATTGLGIVPGSVRRLDGSRVAHVPHVGWNSVQFTKPHPVVTRVRNGVDFYFVHSYHLVVDDAAHVLGRSDCGEEFTSVVAQDNVVGFQFHPEKSQANGLRLLENFCDWDGKC